jgi:hypothetical protein
VRVLGDDMNPNNILTLMSVLKNLISIWRNWSLYKKCLKNKITFNYERPGSLSGLFLWIYFGADSKVCVLSFLLLLIFYLNGAGWFGEK